jgi:hypothetical protein
LGGQTPVFVRDLHEKCQKSDHFYEMLKKWYYIDTPWHPGKFEFPIFFETPFYRCKKFLKNISLKTACPLPPRRAIDKRNFFPEIFFRIFGRKKFVTLAGVKFFEKKKKIPEFSGNFFGNFLANYTG